MSATIWAPLGVGIPASIWSPGGPVTDDGGGGDACELAEQDQLFYENFNNCIFLENFSHPDETLVIGTFPNFGGTDNWVATESAAASAAIIQGAASTDQVNVIQGAENVYTTPMSGPILFNANIGIFSQLYYTAMIRFRSANDGGELRYCEMSFQGDGTTNTLQVKYYNGFGDTFNSAFIDLPYCQWLNINVVPGSNTLNVYVNDVAVYESFNTGQSWVYAPNNGLIQFNAYSEEVNGFRIAAIYITNPFF